MTISGHPCSPTWISSRLSDAPIFCHLQKLVIALLSTWTWLLLPPSFHMADLSALFPPTATVLPHLILTKLTNYVLKLNFFKGRNMSASPALSQSIWGSPWHSRSLVFVEKNPWRAELVGHGLKGLFAFVSMSSQALALLTFRKEKGFAFSKDSNPNPMFPAWMQVQYIQLTKTEWALCKTTKKKEYREHFFLKKPKEMKWVPTALQIGFNLYEN